MSRKRRARRPPVLDEKANLRDERSPDVHLLLAIAAWVSGEPKVATSAARRAFLENLYLPAALRGEQPPKLGLLHGIPEAGPEHACALAEQVRPVLSSAPEARAFLKKLGATPTARRENERFAALARALLFEPDPAARRKLQAEIDELRDPERIEAGSDAALAEAGFGQAGEPPPPCPSFEV